MTQPSSPHIAHHLGCPIAYDVVGSGPVVLMIQVVGAAGSAWLPQVEGLASRFTCITFDNRGMGRSRPAGRPITVEQMADDARAVLDHAGVSAAHVVGHSLGGLVAQHFAAAHPLRTKTLALLCTFATGKDAAPLTARMMWLGLRTRLGTRRMRRRGFLQLVMAPGTVPANADALAAQMAPLFGHDLADQPPVVNEQLKAMRRAAVPNFAVMTSIPTLIATGVHDPIAPPRVAVKLRASIPHSRYAEFPDASHGLPIQHANRVNALLAEHFGQS